MLVCSYKQILKKFRSLHGCFRMNQIQQTLFALKAIRNQRWPVFSKNCSRGNCSFIGTLNDEFCTVHNHLFIGSVQSNKKNKILPFNHFNNKLANSLKTCSFYSPVQPNRFFFRDCQEQFAWTSIFVGRRIR